MNKRMKRFMERQKDENEDERNDMKRISRA